MASLRPARAADCQAMLDLHQSSIRAFGPAAYDATEVDAWADRDEPDYPVDDEDHHVVVAERDGTLAGFGILDSGAREVTAVYVHPDHAQAGVGSTMLSHLESEARERGIDTLGLLASKNAVGFYDQAGYERVETRTHETGNEELECVWMEKPVD